MTLLLVFLLLLTILYSFRVLLFTKMPAMPLLTLTNAKHSFSIFPLLIPPLVQSSIAHSLSPIWVSLFILRAYHFPKHTSILFWIAFRVLLPVGNPESFHFWEKCSFLTP